MKTRMVCLRSLLLGAFVLAAGVVWWRIGMTRSAAKNQARGVLEQINQALGLSNGKELLKSICVPLAVRGRTEMEQMEFVRKALADEVSAEGVQALARDGVFGPLGTVFSNEAARWAGQVGVSVSECVAFRMEKNGVVAEVAIATNGMPRVIRCNNVKQMAL